MVVAAETMARLRKGARLILRGPGDSRLTATVVSFTGKRPWDEVCLIFDNPQFNDKASGIRLLYRMSLESVLVS